MIDLEHLKKDQRQAGYNTQINRQSLADVRNAVALNTAPILVRINPLNPATRDELNAVLRSGAESVMLPMAIDVKEVEEFLQIVASFSSARLIRVVIQVETLLLFVQARELAQLARVVNARKPNQLAFYVGFNDLMIQRGDSFLWQPILDGTLAAFFSHFEPYTVGFAGLTLPTCGDLIPSIELIAEMSHLKCAMTVLRRSFMRDVAAANSDQAIQQIHQAFASLAADPMRMAQLRSSLRERLSTLQRTLSSPL